MSTSRKTSDTTATTESVDIDEIRPYWRNPRRIPGDAVDMVAQSIREFGYQQPIVVDADNVIIVGHTRYAALRRLGVTGPVGVKRATGLTPARVKEYRLIDNKVAEFTSWDYDSLTRELAEIDGLLIPAAFPPPPDPPAESDTTSPPELPASPIATLTCPSCYHEWEATFA